MMMAGALTCSPITCGKVFEAIPRVNKITTPVINQKIGERFGLPLVSSSYAFKAEYVKKREELRRVNGKDPNFQVKLQEIKSSAFTYSTEGEQNTLSHIPYFFDILFQVPQVSFTLRSLR
jgi:hypothetical protein